MPLKSPSCHSRGGRLSSLIQLLTDSHKWICGVNIFMAYGKRAVSQCSKCENKHSLHMQMYINIHSYNVYQFIIIFIWNLKLKRQFAPRKWNTLMMMMPNNCRFPWVFVKRLCKHWLAAQNRSTKYRMNEGIKRRNKKEKKNKREEKLKALAVRS